MTASKVAHPLTRTRILVNGHHLKAEKFGPAENTTVILLHHGLGSLYTWKAQVPALLEAGFCVISYDRWGYGGSDPRSGIDIPHFTQDQDDLKSLMETLGIRQAALVGHSDGGNIALLFAAAYPQRVTRLVIVAAHIYVEPKMVAGLEGVRAQYENDPEFQRKFTRMHGSKATQVFQNWYDGWKKPENLTWDMRPLLKKVLCPTLVVQGEADEHATPQHARDTAEAIPNSDLWLLPECGHLLPQERPDEFNLRLIHFLNT